MRQTILILGGFGFIGSNLIEELLNHNKFNIIVFEFHGAKSTLANQVKVYYGDFNNEEDIEIVFKENKIDCVIHLISTTVPVISNQNIVYDINSNLIGTIQLLNLMLKHKIKRIVFPSSGGTVYGNPTKEKTCETDPTNPISSHGITKLAIEKYLLLFSYLYGLEYLILRISNPFGVYHVSEQQGFINIALKKAMNNEKIFVWGDGNTVKDFIYVKDVVKIISNLMELNVFDEIINIGYGSGFSINQILNMIRKVIPDLEVEYQEPKQYDISRIVLDINKLNSIVQHTYTPIFSGIQMTHEWLRLMNK